MKPITIVGGGLAGLSLGISLRRDGVPVTIWEAGGYPRHRVCGEFISGLGLQVLTRLDLLEAMRRAGAVPAATAVFFAGRASLPVRRLQPPGLCLSRWVMDALLAEIFQAAGGQLRTGERRQPCPPAEGLVRATGREPIALEDGWRWFGLKIHARNVPLDADVEMHALPHGYVGLNRIEGGAVNVCGLFRRRVRADASPAAGRQWLYGDPGSLLSNKLINAEFDTESFCAVAGLGLHPRCAADRPECCVGDALTMIPPVTGNGMSMAFEAAELATGFLAAYSRGRIPWQDARTAIAHACDRAFWRRLAWARWLQRLMFSKLARGALGRALLGSNSIWQMMFVRTRC